MRRFTRSPSCSIGRTRRSRQILAATGGIRPPQRRRSKIGADLGRAGGDLARGGGGSNRSVRSPRGSAERHPQSAGRSSATVAQACYRAAQADQAAWDRAHRPKTVQTGAEPSAGAHRGRQAPEGSGRRSRSPDGSSILIRATRAITCHTRPSTAASSSRRVAP